MHECFWKIEQNSYRAGLPTYDFRMVVKDWQPKIDTQIYITFNDGRWQL
jgi:hypothetical protein